MGVLNVIGVASMLLLFLISVHLSEAGRVLLDDNENWTMKNRLSGTTESKKGPTPPSGHNPVTNNPSPAHPNGHPASTINQRNFAGHTTTENYSTKSKLSGLTESKQKDPTPPGGPNPVTNNPSPAPPNGHPTSTINQRNFVGHTTTENYSTKSKLSGLTESKQKGATPPGGPNPVTNNPSPAPPNGHHASTINQRNFAGHTTTENYSTKTKLSGLTESKQKGPTPPGGPNPVTNNPSPAPPNGHHASTINQRNFAGHTTTENYSTKTKLSGLTESKQKDPTPPGGPNPVTNNPSPAPPNGHHASTINQRNFAGHTTTENYSTKTKLSGLTESKQKGPTPPGGPNPVTNNPSPAPPNGHPASTINQRNFAGHTTTDNYSTKSKFSGLTESKQKGPTPPGGSHGRTNKPGPAPPTSGHAASTINQRNFAGDLLHMRTLTSGFHY
ncbi:hypothetical protein ACLB2K_010720 [Fragaria x ananassa]